MQMDGLFGSVHRLMGVFLSVAVGFAGCSSAPDDMPELAQVTGQLLREGKPVAGAEIRFVPTSAGSLSSAVTDANGDFELRYSQDQLGAAIGTHQVHVTIYGGGGAPPAEAAAAPLATAEEDLESRLPPGVPEEFDLGQHQVPEAGAKLTLEVPADPAPLTPQ